MEKKATQTTLPGIPELPLEEVEGLNLQGRIDRAVALLRMNEPLDGYYLAFSGGKDSSTILKPAQIAGVRFEIHHNFTTIDPPEIVRLVKATPGVIIHMPEKNMFTRIAEHNGGPPTRHRRWCCEEYKEHGGRDRTKVIGVRALESVKRAARWKEVTASWEGKQVICPIVYWSDAHVWEFIRALGVPYCSLYDEGWSRLGCIGCPLSNKTKQKMEFERWPRYAALWKKAVIKNWERFKDLPNKDGNPRFHAKFKTGEEFWMWWLCERRADYRREGCQSGFLWAIEDEDIEIPVEDMDVKYPDRIPGEEWTDYFERKGVK